MRSHLYYLEQLCFLLIVAAVFAYAAWESQAFPRIAQIHPEIVSLVALVLCVIEAVRLFRGWFSGARGAALAPTFIPQLRAGMPYVAWIAAYYAAIYFVGFLIASGVFTFLFLRFIGRASWHGAFLVGLALTVFLVLFGNIMQLHWIEGLLWG